ncbi:hypothetical protein H072_7529 [Dactylellina haptotyla CBS 200.50]|uniref:Selenoprotein W-like protein n=1 Tax=Dactylellina haptotyla (strain CBS 200.50) TaxID=1284197 RepID=S8A7A9_DACHA|nr:hypothetical protein H072_7529 [Dactylellina haptotyla CBS 200.50]
MANEGVNSPPKTASVEACIPKITIQFCIQCKWNLRAAYYAQELLQTFSTSLGEVSLRPSTGGIFIVTLETLNEQSLLQSHLIWDRKRDGGFPETKELKKKVRDIIDPQRDLGHVDGKKSAANPPDQPSQESKDVAARVVDDSVEASKKQDDDQTVLDQTKEAKGKAACEDCQ